MNWAPFSWPGCGTDGVPNLPPCTPPKLGPGTRPDPRQCTAPSPSLNKPHRETQAAPPASTPGLPPPHGKPAPPPVTVSPAPGAEEWGAGPPAQPLGGAEGRTHGPAGRTHGPTGWAQRPMGWARRPKGWVQGPMGWVQGPTGWVQGPTDPRQTDTRTPCWLGAGCHRAQGTFVRPRGQPGPPLPKKILLRDESPSSDDRRDDAKDTSSCRRRGDREGRAARPRETHKSQLLRDALLPSPPTGARRRLSSSPSPPLLLPSLRSVPHSKHSFTRLAWSLAWSTASRRFLASTARVWEAVSICRLHSSLSEVTAFCCARRILLMRSAKSLLRSFWVPSIWPGHVKGVRGCLTPLPPPPGPAGPYLGAGGGGQDGQDLVHAADQLAEGQAHVLRGEQ